MHKCKVFKADDGLWEWECRTCGMNGWRWYWRHAFARAFSHVESNYP